MNNAKLMVILIVLICRQAVEPTAVPRSYWSVATVAAASATTITPTSCVSSRLCLSLQANFVYINGYIFRKFKMFFI